MARQNLPTKYSVSSSVAFRSACFGLIAIADADWSSWTHISGIKVISKACFAAAILVSDVVADERPNGETELPRLSDEQLLKTAEKVISSYPFRFPTEKESLQYETLLSEMVRRGNDDFRKQVGHYSNWLKTRKFRFGDREEERGVQYNLELLTAFRRLQGQLNSRVS